MHSQINLTERSLTQYFAYSVEVDGRLGCNILLPKAQLNQFDQFTYLLGSRSQVTVDAAGSVAFFCDQSFTYLGSLRWVWQLEDWLDS